jgi:hypothetical protein
VIADCQFLFSVMRKIIFCFFIFLLAAQIGFAQYDSDDSLPHLAQSAIAISAGQFHANFSALNSELASRGATKTLGSTFNTVGINWAESAEFGFDAALCLEFLLPKNISDGDSTKFHLYGWHFMMSMLGVRIVNSKHVAVTAGPGFDFGNVKILASQDGMKTNYYNPFISPFARAEVRYAFWKIVIGSRISYRFDLSKSQWKQSGDLSPFPGSKISGLGFQFFLGWGTGW